MWQADGYNLCFEGQVVAKLPPSNRDRNGDMQVLLNALNTDYEKSLRIKQIEENLSKLLEILSEVQQES